MPIDCQCGICIEEFPEKELIRYCDGKHVFCKSCINRWMMENDYDGEYEYTSCPVCRSEISIFSGYPDGTHTQYYLGKCDGDSDDENDEDDEGEDEDEDEEKREEPIRKLREFTMKKGMLDGPYQEWTPEGFPRLLTFYRKGELHGTHREFHSDSFVCKRVVNYKNGKKEGRQTERSCLGYVSAVTEYRDGVRNGRQITYHCKFDHIDLDGRLMTSEGDKMPIIIEMETYEHPENPVGVRKLQEGFYKDDIQDGEWKTWHPDGSLHTVSTFRDQKRNGLYIGWYSKKDGGEMEWKVNMIAGNREGYSYRWHPNGRLKSVSYYIEDKQHGIHYMWDEYGHIITTRYMFKGCEHGPYREWNEYGFLILDENRWRGRTHGWCRRYFEGTHQLASERFINDSFQKHGTERAWYCERDPVSGNYRLKYRIDFVKGMKEGLHEIWYSPKNSPGPGGDGNGLQARTHYVADKKHGIYQEWWPNGQLKIQYNAVDDYRDGLFQRWAENGTLVEQYWSVKDCAEGLHTFWHDNGVKAKEYTCVNDKPVGLCQEWDRDGVLKREPMMIMGIWSDPF
jgi:antitoxin component YwqK of YwqJK toxin-antitoxin module